MNEVDDLSAETPAQRKQAEREAFERFAGLACRAVEVCSVGNETVALRLVAGRALEWLCDDANLTERQALDMARAVGEALGLPPADIERVLQLALDETPRSRMRLM
jgi:hypothetical protein